MTTLTKTTMTTSPHAHAARTPAHETPYDADDSRNNNDAVAVWLCHRLCHEPNIDHELRLELEARNLWMRSCI